MHFLLEAIFVGIYVLPIDLFLSIFISNFALLLFSVGFLKHFIGSFVIHEYYCKYGAACNRSHDTSEYHVDLSIIECILEGIAYICLGYFIRYIYLFGYLKNKLVIVFVVSILLHILVELFGGHAYFCKNRCKVV